MSERCPHCDAEKAAPILYGLPSGSAWAAADRGELIIGGCEPAGYSNGCVRCGSMWSVSDDLSTTAISEIFADYFDDWGIQLPPGSEGSGGRGSISKQGWTIDYLFGSDDSGRYLEFYATHRMTEDQRVRIYQSGQVEHLDAIQGMYLYDPKVPGAAEAAAAKNLERNQRVADELRGLGIYPDGNINAYLRTHDVPLQEEEEQTPTEGMD